MFIHSFSKYHYRYKTIFRQHCGYRNAEDINRFITSARKKEKIANVCISKPLSENISQSFEGSHNKGWKEVEMH